MQIDSHRHFGRYDAVRDSWIAHEFREPRRDFLPEHPAPELGPNGIDATVAAPDDQSEDETHFPSAEADRNDGSAERLEPYLAIAFDALERTV